MPRPPSRPFRHALPDRLVRVAAALALIGALAAGPGSAAMPALFHSPADDGVAPDDLPVETGGPAVTLFLYLDAGAIPTASGSVCEDGDGDELCAWEFSLSVGGAAEVVAFLPDPTRDVVYRTSPRGLAAVGGDALAGELGPIRLGALDLDVTSNGWTVRITGGSTVDAAFSLTALAPGATIAAPEPGGGLAIALLGLCAWARRRRAPPSRSAHLLPSARSLARAATVTLVAASALLTSSGMAWAQDADGDGVMDTIDNCPWVANPGQEDVAGLLGPPGDGIGDACQCGDVNGDGSVDLLDAATYQRGLANALPTLLDGEKCSVVGSRVDCDANDRQTLREAIVGTAPGVAPVCRAANPPAAPPTSIGAAGDSITQGFAADCTCNDGNFFEALACLLCPAGGDQPEYSWFDGASLGASYYGLYGGSGAGLTSNRVSVSGAEMTSGGDRFEVQAANLVSLAPTPDLVVVELGGNDVCNRGCVDPSNCADPLYDDATWQSAIEAGLDRLVGFGFPTALAPGATVYLLGVPRIQDLWAAGVAKQTGNPNVDCDDFRDDFDVCEIATLDAVVNGEDLPTRLAALETRIPRYNEILRDTALAYTTNANGRNPNGIEIVTDYVNESIPSVGTTAFGAAEINGGDCFHPSIFGQSTLAGAAWFSTPR